VSVHEFGHQYFYGMLGSNEFEEPWLDEGFNSWFTAKAMEETYHGLFSSRRLHTPSDFQEWSGYWLAPSTDPLTRKGWLLKDQEAYWILAYNKPTMVLDQLEALLGRPVMERVMKAYTMEMAMKHPTRADFKRIAERVSGRDLSAFWRDFVEGTGVLDYAIDEVSVRTRQQGGWMDSPKGPKFVAPGVVADGRSGAITLERKGEIQVPVTLWVRLESGKELRLTWDGQDRWRTFTADDGLDAPVASAVLDPDGNYPMLKDRLHASWTAAPATRGIHYWSQLLWGGLTALLQGAGLG
ncbi:MAG TPA: M1 family aminopeptidase, partial [Holophagaceae bacterium]|nr:M1 family aminopeptidase [Holophagaceae bacterium]